MVVTINHRLNVLGFTYLGEPGGPEYSASGDVGMLDIVRALEWVRDNITRFGGDPGTVTVFGQSGGGRKVATLLAMPEAKGLFHRAIIESGATLKLVERDQATRVASELMKTNWDSNKTRVRDLQMAPLDKVMSAYFEDDAADERGPDDAGVLAGGGRKGRAAASVFPAGGNRVGRRSADARLDADRADLERRGRVVLPVGRRHAQAHRRSARRGRRRDD